MYFEKQKKVAYLVFEGRTRGIFEKWADCKNSVDGYPGARFRGYTDTEKAYAEWIAFEETGEIPGSPRKAPKRKAISKGPPMEPKARKTNPMEAVVAKFNTSPGHGSRTITCTSTGCNYPSCTCGG